MNECDAFWLLNYRNIRTVISPYRQMLGDAMCPNPVINYSGTQDKKKSDSQFYHGIDLTLYC